MKEEKHLLKQVADLILQLCEGKETIQYPVNLKCDFQKSIKNLEHKILECEELRLCDVSKQKGDLNECHQKTREQQLKCVKKEDTCNVSESVLAEVSKFFHIL